MAVNNIKVVTKTADAAAISGRTRVRSIYFTCTNTASSFSLKNGAAGTAPALVTINTPADAGGHVIDVPDNGLLFDKGVYIDVANAEVTSVSLFYEGGAEPAS